LSRQRRAPVASGEPAQDTESGCHIHRAVAGLECGGDLGAVLHGLVAAVLELGVDAGDGQSKPTDARHQSPVALHVDAWRDPRGVGCFEVSQLPRQDLGFGHRVVDDLGVNLSLDRGVVAGRHAQSGVVARVRVDCRWDVDVAGHHRQQCPRTLGERSPYRVGLGEVQFHRGRLFRGESGAPALNGAEYSSNKVLEESA
jgi:hypothetical protein